jgi:UDP-GlcNAc:undecaprenyl-phosphate/decaprenyl-phosphate GlcNAc-1-phosphate transferase
LATYPFLTQNLTGFLTALVLTMVAVPLVWKWAVANGYYDAPGERKIHKWPIPRLGGIAIFAGFMGSVLMVCLMHQFPFDNTLTGVLVGSSMIFTLGLVDDLKNLSPKTKLLIQIVSVITIFMLNIQINTLDLPGAQLLILNALSLPVTAVWIIGLMNAVNFIDGIDGLAAGITLFSALTLTIIAMFTGQYSSALLASILAGASLGFLVFNFHPAKIFMGDSGALLCGFLLALIAVTGVLKTKMVVMILPIMVLGVPILDITYSVFRRLLSGKSPLIADANHIHHQLLKSGAGQIKTVSYLYILCITGGLLSVWYLNNLLLYLVSLISILLLGALLILLVRVIWPNPKNRTE